ncbi:MAG: RIP metalloprotease RseP, partial [Planctomycetaceae bacterium]
MAIVEPLVLAVSVQSALNILYVAIGLGLVIFFHELGHFAVAKWCDVHVERFSIGFGPILWRFKRKGGETEYALSAIPFGGYVKMLGQDDMDPSQLTAEEIAQDPRAYSAKSVPQRMAIISAGVIMNIITAALFFAVAFLIGIEADSPIIGSVDPGTPAWVAGIEPGDTPTRIDDREIVSFGDLMRGVALSSGKITLHGQHADGEEFEVTIQPASGERRILGVRPAGSLEIADFENPAINPTEPGTPAHRAKPKFQSGDRIVQLNDQPVHSYAELHEHLARHASEPITFHVRRGEKTVEIPVAANPVRTLGLIVEIGPVIAIQSDSPAAAAGLQEGDKIIQFQGREVGKEINPLRLPDLFQEHAGEPVPIVVQREKQTHTLTVVPRDEPNWADGPLAPNTPVAVPSIGVAYHLIPVVLGVEPDSPAAKQGIKPGDRIRSMVLTL